MQRWLRAGLLRRLAEQRTPGEAVLGPVPPLDRVFAVEPAQQVGPSARRFGREIDQATRRVAQDDAAALEISNERLQLPSSARTAGPCPFPDADGPPLLPLRPCTSPSALRAASTSSRTRPTIARTSGSAAVASSSVHRRTASQYVQSGRRRAPLRSCGDPRRLPGSSRHLRRRGAAHAARSCGGRAPSRCAPSRR